VVEGPRYGILRKWWNEFFSRMVGEAIFAVIVRVGGCRLFAQYGISNGGRAFGLYCGCGCVRGMWICRG